MNTLKKYHFNDLSQKEMDHLIGGGGDQGNPGPGSGPGGVGSSATSGAGAIPIGYAGNAGSAIPNSSWSSFFQSAADVAGSIAETAYGTWTTITNNLGFPNLSRPFTNIIDDMGCEMGIESMCGGSGGGGDNQSTAQKQE